MARFVSILLRNFPAIVHLPMLVQTKPVVGGGEGVKLKEVIRATYPGKSP